MHTNLHAILLRGAAAVFCWSLAGAAFAACPVDPPHYRVGSMATDVYCHYDTIQDAIDAVPRNNDCPVVIDITREHLYGNGGHCSSSGPAGCHLEIENRNLVLQGWGDGVTCQVLSGSACPQCTPDTNLPLVTLDGANTGGPVLRIKGEGFIPNPRRSNVTLRNLTITHGNAGSGRGGGIHFTGNGSLNLVASTVSFNTALNGGGIAFDANEPSSLMLGSNTQILMNTGSSTGGGIALTGRAFLGAFASGTVILGNKAPDGLGGGIYVQGPARADLGSSGQGAWGFIATNEAKLGGGIAVNATATDASVRLFRTDARLPARINGNRAYQYGGGVYLLPGESSRATLCALDFRIDGNKAAAGSAIFGDTTVSGTTPGARVLLGTLASESVACTEMPFGPASSLALPCARGSDCNQIDHNLDIDGNNFHTGGPAIWLGEGGTLTSTALAMRANEGGAVISTYQSTVRVENCLLVDSLLSPTAPLLSLGGSTNGGTAPARFHNCSFAGNTLAAGAPVLWVRQGLELRNSIIDQPGHDALDFSDPDQNLLVFSVLANEIDSLLPPFAISDGAVLAGAPTFVDAAGGDYHQKPGSQGVDFSSNVMLLDPRRDLDGLQRVVDVPGQNNYLGPLDLGPYELQLSACGDGGGDTVYCDDFDGNGMYANP